MASDMTTGLCYVTRKLHELADSKGVASVKELIHEAGDRVQASLEAYNEAVEAWAQNDLPNLEAARREAFAKYHEELSRAKTILADLGV